MKNHTTLSIILIGNELLSGDIIDKNAKYLLEKIDGTSLKALHVVSVRDDKEAIARVVKEQMSLSELVVCSGGLGPTSDDITILTIAETLSLPLVENKESLERLKEKYAARGRSLNSNSMKQVLFPEGAEILPNEVGTADGCVLSTELSGRISSIACLPGVPKEFTYLLDTPLWNWIENKLNVKKTERALHYRIFGLAESSVGTAIDEAKILPEDISIAYRPQFPELLLSLKSTSRSLDELEEYFLSIKNILDPSCFFTKEKDSKLSSVLATLLTEKGKSLAFAESCTGGRLSSEISKIPGSSGFFKGSIISYSNEMKINFLDIPPALIERVGAVSAECAQHMADGIAHKTGADYAVSVTGIAGPGGETKDKKVGTVFIGFSSHEKRTTFEFSLPWDRERNQIYASWLAMDLVRRDLLGLALEVRTL
jgi:nicotinamide-nucleotide amidase